MTLDWQSYHDHRYLAPVPLDTFNITEMQPVVPNIHPRDPPPADDDAPSSGDQQVRSSSDTHEHQAASPTADPASQSQSHAADQLRDDFMSATTTEASLLDVPRRDANGVSPDEAGPGVLNALTEFMATGASQSSAVALLSDGRPLRAQSDAAAHFPATTPWEWNGRSRAGSPLLTPAADNTTNAATQWARPRSMTSPPA